MPFFLFFFFNDTATTEIYTLSLHDALPISFQVQPLVVYKVFADGRPDELVRGVDIVGTPLAALTKIVATGDTPQVLDRKSTRLNSSHGYISYAVFCLKKKKKQ